jgi:hypothetical protein
MCSVVAVVRAHTLPPPTSTTTTLNFQASIQTMPDSSPLILPALCGPDSDLVFVLQLHVWQQTFSHPACQSPVFCPVTADPPDAGSLLRNAGDMQPAPAPSPAAHSVTQFTAAPNAPRIGLAWGPPAATAPNATSPAACNPWREHSGPGNCPCPSRAPTEVMCHGSFHDL